MQRQHALADRLLQRVLLNEAHSPQLRALSRAAHEGWELRVRQQAHKDLLQQSPGKVPPHLRFAGTRERREARQQWLDQQPWYIDWGQRLGQVAHSLRALPYALLDARFFMGAQQAVAVGALGRVLQAVAGARAAGVGG